MRQNSHRAPTQRRGTGARVAGGALPIVLAVAGAGLAGIGPAAAAPTHTTAAPIPVAPLPAPLAAMPSTVSYQLPQVRNNTDGFRPMPNHTWVAPMRGVRLPVPVAPVAPIAAPKGTVRVGNFTVAKPAFLSDQQAAQINGAAAGVEAQVATLGDAMGLDPSRSDLVASDVVTDGAIGASLLGGTVGLPMAATGALIGAVNGLVIGAPFLPIGLVVGPIAGAGFGAAVSVAPFALVGGALGAAAGVVQGVTAPTHLSPVPHHR